MDPIEATGGLIVARTTADGAPTGFEVDDATMTVVRGGARQEIPVAEGLGGVALCNVDGSVLGYGTLSIEDIEALAAAIGTPGDSGPLARLRDAGYALAAPLDAMPQEIRDMFLAEHIDPGLVEDAGITDEAIAEAMAQHDHEHTDDCEVCGMQDVADRVGGIIATAGHAVVVMGDSPGQVSYTVGLDDAGWPELAMSGIPSRAIQILNAAVEALRARETRPVAGMVIDGALSVSLRLRTIDEMRTGGVAKAWARGQRRGEPEFLQLTWPDADGYHPGDMEYDDLNLPQTLL